jgi:hypothetical protein
VDSPVKVPVVLTVKVDVLEIAMALVKMVV